MCRWEPRCLKQITLLREPLADILVQDLVSLCEHRRHRRLLMPTSSTPPDESQAPSKAQFHFSS